MAIDKDCGCESARERLSALIDRELCDVECDDVRAHCETCADCREELALYSQVTVKLRNAVAEAPPPGLADHILKIINGGSSGI